MRSHSAQPLHRNIWGAQQVMLRTLRDLPVEQRRVIVRVDFNVPLHHGRVADDSRIEAAIPTIRELIRRRAKIILISHLGRPKDEPADELRLTPVAERLAQLLKHPVKKLDVCIGSEVEAEINTMRPGDVLLLENLRFYPGEKKNDPMFVSALAELGDFYVDDAFGVVHRAHASTVGVAERLPSAAGLHLESEIDALDKVLKDPSRPYWVMVGGAKLSDKIGVLVDLLPHVNGFMLGGGIVFTFFKALGKSVGTSILDESLLSEAKDFLVAAQRQGVEVILPVDIVVAPKLEPKIRTRIVSMDAIPNDQQGLDIGPETVKLFKEKIQYAKTLLWSGPLGAFETPPFGTGTFQIAHAIAESPGTFALIGGGDTASALKNSGVTQVKNMHISTGGGATLEYLTGKKLPALEVLQKE